MTATPKTKTAAPALEAREIALKDLTLHPLNARAGSPATYAADDIPVLAASIAALGLLNPLVVQRVEVDGAPVWGVLAGGRRLAALRQLAEDRASKGWTKAAKIACRVLGEDVAHATAITVAENVTQTPMDPLDEFEAFARMVETGGHSIEGVARTFGVETRRVAERLRYGRVHPDIRAAARAKAITLDVMKAFAAHPDHGTQWAVFEATEGSYRQAWTIRGKLEQAGTKLDSKLGRYVEAEYRAADGPIAADLIEEDSVLSDAALVERVLIEKLGQVAEAERARTGLAWAEARRTLDYEALRPFGRTYAGPIEPEGIEAVRATEIADRMVAIDALRDEAEAGWDADEGDPADGAGETPDLDALEDEYVALMEEHERLTTGWTDEQRARAGLIAHWGRDGVELASGLIRPEDRTDRAASGSGRTASASGIGDGSADEDGAGGVALEVPASLAADLRTERAVVIGAGLAADPELAQDFALFTIAADLLQEYGSRASWAFGVHAKRGDRPHGKRDEVDPAPAAAVTALRADLDMRWRDDVKTRPAQFEAFRLLDRDMKARIVAVGLAEAVDPHEMGHGEDLLLHVARQAVPDMRAAWRPTGGAFFARIKKGGLLHLLATDLKQPEEAARLATAKKTEIIDYLDRLFAAPFATLTAEQREAVETWMPPGMALPQPRARDASAMPAEEDLAEDETFDADPDDDPDEDFGADPIEAFDPDEAADASEPEPVPA